MIMEHYYNTLLRAQSVLVVQLFLLCRFIEGHLGTLCFYKTNTLLVFQATYSLFVKCASTHF